MTLEEWRRFYASLGFATIPLRPREKRPLRKGWLDGSAEQWVGAPEDVNIGILTGTSSRDLVVLDFDTRDGPTRELGMTPEQLAVLTVVVETARGWHVYTRYGKLATGTPRAGLDVRANGAMVVAPPSVHPCGHEYRFVGSTREIIALEAIAAELCFPPVARPDARWEAADAWIALQAPKLREAWRKLNDAPSASFDASRADFAVARCLWEGGWSAEEVAALLLALPGSRAQERGESYAVLTVEKAFSARRPNRGLSGRPAAHKP